MNKVIKIVLTFFLVFATVKFSSSHQGHLNKQNEVNVSFQKSSNSIKSTVSEEFKNNNSCSSKVLTGSECCCCVNGICFQMNKRNECGTDQTSEAISCRKHCEDADSKDNNIIIQNVKTQNIYKIYITNNS